MIKLIVGLGNPGVEYEQTRHNAGFWWIDKFTNNFKLSLSYDKNFWGQTKKHSVSGKNIWILKPQTFMNVSGKSVSALSNFFRITPDEILIVHDELDIDPGKAKLKFGGGHAGHNGLRDIHQKLGTADYWRLRLGIGHPGLKTEVSSWVLNRPTMDEQNLIFNAIDKSYHAIEHFVNGDMDKALHLVNKIHND
jgi:PTH1 family peptidyl-tRNA hydrolase